MDSAGISADPSSKIIFDSILQNTIDNLGFETIANRNAKLKTK